MPNQPDNHLVSPPVVFVLSQIRFNPMLRMDKYVPDIQEALRISGFTSYKAEETQVLVIAGPGPQVKKSTRWLFTNKERTESVVLANDFLVYQVSKYTRFTDFLDKLCEVIETVKSIAKIDSVERIGLRYLDLIQDQADLKRSQALYPGLHGFPENNELWLQPPQQFQEARGKTHLGEMGLRIWETIGQDFLPPDLIPTQLVFQRKISDDERVSLLDSDHYKIFHDSQCDFSKDDISSNLHALHDVINLVFFNCVTPEALAAWNRGDSSDE